MTHADYTFIYKNLSIGGGVFNDSNMAQLAEAGVTHILNAKCEWDETPLAKKHGIESLWCPTVDDFTKPPVEQFERAFKFSKRVLKNPHNVLHVVCAGGVHRGPMYALLACGSIGMDIEIVAKRILHFRMIAEFPTVYYDAVANFLEEKRKERRSKKR